MAAEPSSAAALAVSDSLRLSTAQREGGEDDDAFLLITRQPSLASLHPGQSSRRFSITVDHLHSNVLTLSRNWPLICTAAADLITALSNIAYHQSVAVHDAVLSTDLLRLRTLGLIRPISLAILALHSHWRRGSVWVITASVITLLTVLWEVNEGVQWRKVERGETGSRLFVDLNGDGFVLHADESRTRSNVWEWTWLRRVGRDEMLVGLILQTFFAIAEYLVFFLSLHLSPYSPLLNKDPDCIKGNPPSADVRPVSRFVPRSRSAKIENAVQTQRATSVKWDEEEAFARGSAGSPSERRGGLGGPSRTLANMSEAELNPWADESDERHTAAGDHPDGSDGESSPSIGRFSDEGDDNSDAESDGSISSNEIIDLPPPRSASYRGLNPTSSPSVNRIPESPRHSRTTRIGSGFASILGERGSSGTARMLSGPDAEFDVVEREQAEHEALLEMSSTPPRDESRLERGLRKRWMRRAKDVFARNRTKSDISVVTGSNGQYGAIHGQS